MFCTSCGATISDEAKFCPHCGEDLKEVIDILKETPSTSDISSEESDIELSLEEDVEILKVLPNEVNKFYLKVKNNSSIPISNIKVKLTGPPQVELLTNLINFQVIEAKSTNNAPITVLPRESGIFTLRATLQSGVGHSLTLPIVVRVKTAEDSRIPITTSKPSVRVNQALAGFIIVFLIGLLLIGIGISTLLRGGSHPHPYQHP